VGDSALSAEITPKIKQCSIKEQAMTLLTRLLKSLCLSVAARRVMSITAVVWELSLPTGASAAGLLTPVGGGPALDLSEQHVSVVIENGYAVTQVEQVRRWDGITASI
jgi:hypothetical protein